MHKTISLVDTHDSFWSCTRLNLHCNDFKMSSNNNTKYVI